jgi:hypothetical protein
MMFKCHCRDCQHVSGGGYAAVVYMPLEAFKLTKGALRYYFTQSGATGQHKRGFCGDCGSRITGGETELGIGVQAGSLDDPSFFQPQMDIFVEDAQHWDILDPNIAKFEKYPPM